jgi:hypothetical protein
MPAGVPRALPAPEVSVPRSVGLLVLLLALPVLLAAQPRRSLVVRNVDLPAGVRLDTIGRLEKVAAPAAATFDAVVTAFTEFGIPRNTESVAGGEVGNVELVTRRTFAGERASLSVDCGRGMTGSYADSYRLRLAVVTWVSPMGAAPDSSTLHTALVGGARAVDGTSAWPVQCASLGRFEKRLAARVRELVQSPGR